MNDYSLGTNKRGSMAENSFLIVEDSFDALTENKNNQLGLNPNNLDFSDSHHKKTKHNDTIPTRKVNEIEDAPNDFFTNSFLLLKFNNEIAKNGFNRFEKQ